MKNETNVTNRRMFLRQSAIAAAALAALPAALLGCARGDGSLAAPTAEPSAGGSLSWRTRIGTDAEPGEPLVVSGTIYASDGRTALEGATLYVYHTDASGYYADRSGDPREVARLRGRMLTGRDGRYEFRTIKPGAYPGRRDPVHIHASVKAPGVAERWIDDYWFDGDARLSQSERDRHGGAGTFSPVLRLTRDASGVLRATRDIKVG